MNHAKKEYANQALTSHASRITFVVLRSRRNRVMSAPANPNLKSMKNVLISLVAFSVLALPVHAAEVSTKLTGVHLCCPSCVKGVTKAVDGIQGVTATASQDDSTVTLTGPDAATVQ